ncbi:MAG: putative hydroxymethylpyrimidine transporter CytX [Candidatus Atribacteria bacterium]
MNGIKPIKKEERNLVGIDFLLLWSGAAISLAEILAGGILVPLGLVAGILAILLGHIIGNTPFALGGIIGSEQGIPSMVSVRPSFGNRGSYLPAFLNVVQLIGWTAVMLIICAKSAEVISQKLFGYSNFQLWVIMAGAITTLWAFFGHKTWKWLHRISVTALLLLCLVMTYVVFKEHSFGELMKISPNKDLSFAIGLDIVIAMPISWLPLVADYSRFAKNTPSSFWGTWWGYLIVSSWMYFVGLSASLATGSADPIPMLLNLGLGVAALVIVLFSTFTTTFLDIYSTSVSALNVFPQLGEKRGVIIGGILGTLVALVFPIEQYENFLLFIGAMFCPLFGIVLTDYFILRKRKYFPEDIYKKGRYWYSQGVNIVAILSWIIGVVLYQQCIKYGLWIGSSIPSMFVSGIIYLIIMKKIKKGNKQ